MIRTLLVFSALLASACASPAPAETVTAPSPTPGRFSAADLSYFSFLEGRWTGIGPDGQPIYEQGSFPDKYRLRIESFDSTFTSLRDRVQVYAHDGHIVSQHYGDTWRATEVRDGFAAFEPVNAPNAFHWKRIDANTIELLRRTTGEDGKPRSYTIMLKRVG